MSKAIQRYLLEVCVDNVEDALRAEAAGADRIEVCRALECGGLTPSPATIDALLQSCNLPIVVLIRERPGNFVFNGREKASMLEDVNRFTLLGVEGVAVGALQPTNEIDLEFMTEIRKTSTGSAVVMHRAFDYVVNYERSALELAAIRIDRILTSGCAEHATEGLKVLSHLQASCAHLIDILVAGGVRSTNAQQILRATGVHQIHSSSRTSNDLGNRSENIFSDIEVKRLATIVRDYDPTTVP